MSCLCCGAVLALKRNDAGNSFEWTEKVGTAFRNRDGSLSLYLDAMPRDGKLLIRFREVES